MGYGFGQRAAKRAARNVKDVAPARLAGAKETPLTVVPSPGRVFVAVAGERTTDMGLAALWPVDAQIAENVDFASPQRGLGVIGG